MSTSSKSCSLAGAFAAIGLLLGPCLPRVVAAPRPREVKVRCDAGETIGGALSRLDPLVPAVVRVSGACRENVLIRGFDDLRIVGAAGATLEVVASPALYAIEVATSRLVSFERLTIQGAGDRVAMGLGGCSECRVTEVTVNGGIGLYAYDGGKVKLSRFRTTGTGGWASVGAWRSVSLDVEDSVFEDTSGGLGRWCGLCVGENATANVYRSSFRGYGQGISANAGAHLQLYDGTIIEGNWCTGLTATTGAALTVHTGTRVANNGSGCFEGGIRVDTAATLSLFPDDVPARRVEVVDNVGGGIDLNHRAVAYFDADSLVSGNTASWGLNVRNGSMAIAPSPWASPPRSMTFSGNTGGDLSCDSISHINNAAQIIGATNNSCANLSSDDEPGAP
jgi:hypothetical protein